MIELHEVREGHHEGVLNAAVMGRVLHLFRKNIAGVDDAGDVTNGDVARGGEFVDLHLAEVDVLDAFICKGDAPVDSRLVVIEDADGGEGVGHVKVGGDVANTLEGGDAFLGGHDICFA